MQAALQSCYRNNLDFVIAAIIEKYTDAQADSKAGKPASAESAERFRYPCATYRIGLGKS